MKLKIINLAGLAILLTLFTQIAIFAQSVPAFSKVEFNNEIIPIPSGPIKTAINLVRMTEIKIVKN